MAPVTCVYFQQLFNDSFLQSKNCAQNDANECNE